MCRGDKRAEGKSARAHLLPADLGDVAEHDVGAIGGQPPPPPPGLPLLLHGQACQVAGLAGAHAACRSRVAAVGIGRETSAAGVFEFGCVPLC